MRRPRNLYVIYPFLWLGVKLTTSQITDKELIDLLVSILDSPYANYLTRQFVLTALTKISSRPTTTPAQQERIQNMLLSYTTSPELEIQQRAVEFASLFNLGEIRSGVLERMPAPELKATVLGVGASRCNVCQALCSSSLQSARTSQLDLLLLGKTYVAGSSSSYQC